MNEVRTLADDILGVLQQVLGDVQGTQLGQRGERLGQLDKAVGGDLQTGSQRCQGRRLEQRLAYVEILEVSQVDDRVGELVDVIAGHVQVLELRQEADLGCTEMLNESLRGRNVWVGLCGCLGRDGRGRASRRLLERLRRVRLASALIAGGSQVSSHLLISKPVR